MAVPSAQVSAKPRSELGSRANKRLRDAGMLPGVIYGHKEAVVPITLPKKEVASHLSHGAHLFDLTLDGKSQKVLIKEVQYDHLGLELIHVDFARVSLDEKVEVTVPLELKGTPKGEEEGAVLQQLVAELEIECLVTDIPEIIRHNVTEMGKDSVLKIKDLQFPPGVKSMQDPELLVATVREIQEEVAAPEAAEGEAAEPEVIGKGKEEAAEGEAAEGGAAAPAAPAAKKE
ncbi:MAG TPA: 50S ribosomal protein L25 [Tepidisphaeraceae bacterium]|jgi:large subunit ribosomal protein L25